LIVAGVLFFGSNIFVEKRLPMVSFFHGSVAGLRVGAPVTFRGVPIGEVTSIGIRIDPDNASYIIQVNMHFLAGTVRLYGGNPPPPDDELIPSLVQRGLTAQLVQESFLTKLLDVNLEFRPGAPVSRLGQPTAVPEVPTVAGDWETFTKKLQEVDVAGALAAAEQTLTTVNQILNSPEVKQTIHDLPQLTEAFRHTLNTIDREVASLSATGREAIAGSSVELKKTLSSVQTLAADLDREATSTLTAVRGTVKNANTSIEGANALLDPRGRTVIQVQRTIDDLAAAAARMRSFTERVDRDPAMLVRGR
jgi:phospholipid/cholesterol/gamma-HCH transport system substrate-binding protein